MSKLEVIDGKQTTWEGLWWHPDCQYYSSAAISLAQLRKFKGNVRLYVKKNRFFENGKNGRPNYNFSLRDANSDSVRELDVEDIHDDEWCHDNSQFCDEFNCSICGTRCKVESLDALDFSFRFCPSCGAEIRR